MCLIVEPRVKQKYIKIKDIGFGKQGNVGFYRENNSERYFAIKHCNLEEEKTKHEK